MTLFWKQGLSLVLIMISLTFLIGVVAENLTTDNQTFPAKTPVQIKNGPISDLSVQASGSRFWFQVGAIGDNAFSNYGASVKIKTVYDKTSDDAHSYWVGGYLGGGAFIQVGYLTTISTTGSSYCCAWFYEYFPTQNGSCCNPVIGPEFSAGPIGSWHTYKMNSNLDGTWSFFMDDNLLALPGQTNATGTTPYLGASNIDSGNNAPAALAEVADAADANDILGPGEFRDLTYRPTSSTSYWPTVPRGLGFKGYGQPSSHILANPYNSINLHGINNDILAGSYLPVLPQPATSVVFWPNTLVASPTNFVFYDRGGGVFLPDWISLRDQSDPSSLVFYSNYTGAALEDGNWLLDTTIWHNVNVTDATSIVLGGGTNQITSRVYPVVIKVVGYLYSYPIREAKVSSSFPDTIPVNATSDSNGDAHFSQLPMATYNFHAQVPRGLAATIRSQVAEATSLVVRVLGTPELLTILIVPVTAAVLILITAIRKEQARRRLWESQMMATPPAGGPPPQSPPPSQQ